MNSFSGIGFKPSSIMKIPTSEEMQHFTAIANSIYKKVRFKEMNYKILSLIKEKEELEIESKCSKDRKEKRKIRQKIRMINYKIKRTVEEQQAEIPF